MLKTLEKIFKCHSFHNIFALENTVFKVKNVLLMLPYNVFILNKLKFKHFVF